MSKLIARLAVIVAVVVSFRASAAALPGTVVAQAPPPPPPPPVARPLRPPSAELEERQPEPAPELEPAPEPAPEVTPEEAPPVIDEPATQPAPEPAPTPEPTSEPAPPAETIIIPPSIGTPEESPAPAPAAEPGPAEATPAAEPYDFIKGDLLYPGTRRLLSRYDHFGVALGGSIIDSDLYVSVAPGMAWYFDFGLGISAHVPLNLLAVVGNGGNFEFGGMKVRRQDWDEVADFAKVIRFISYGRKEDNIYATINTMRPSTIGHGMILKRYQGDIDVDRSLTSLIFDAYNDYGGFQLQANDITFQNLVVGGLAFIKPLSFFTDNLMAQSLSLGVEYVTDINAPRCVIKNFDPASEECVRGAGHSAGRSPYGGARLDDTFVRTDEKTGRFRVATAQVHVLGGSAEFKFYKDERNLDLKAYATVHKYLNEGGGDGEAGGVLARINLGEDWRHAFRIRGEFRTFDDGFLPAYFDSLYEIQKYAYLYRATDYQVAATKYQYVFGDAANGFTRIANGRRYGFNAEVHWALFEKKRSGKWLAIGFGIQDSSGPDDSNFYLHLEGNVWGILQLFGTYMRTNMKGLDLLFSSITSQDAILLAGVRLQILPIMFINAHYSRSFRAVRTPGSEYHLGNETILDPRTGAPSPSFHQDRLFENVQSLFVELEFGWEFDEDYGDDDAS